MPDAQNASSGFALRTYLFSLMIRNLAQRGPDEAPERLPAEQGGGRKRIEMILLLWNYNQGSMGTNIFLLLITVCIVMILITGCMNNSDNSVNVPTTTVSPSVTDQDVTQNAPSMMTTSITSTPSTATTMVVSPVCTVNYETGTCPIGKCWVHDYCRKDGTHVNGYCRKCE